MEVQLREGDCCGAKWRTRVIFCIHLIWAFLMLLIGWAILSVLWDFQQSSQIIQRGLMQFVIVTLSILLFVFVTFFVNLLRGSKHENASLMNLRLIYTNFLMLFSTLLAAVELLDPHQEYELALLICLCLAFHSFIRWAFDSLNQQFEDLDEEEFV